MEIIERKKYVQGKFLGKGGFATVFELTDCSTGEKYAAKIIEKEDLNNESRR